MGRASTKQNAPTPTPSRALSRISWPELALACSCSFAPRYWLTTTAPPVASAANSTMMRLLIISTRLTPEMAASPQRETIMVSAMPTVTASSCSTSSGPTSLSRSRWLNSGARPPKHRALFCAIVCSILFLASSHTFSALPGRRASFSHRCIHHNTAASCCKESASVIPDLCPQPVLVSSLCQMYLSHFCAL